MIGNCPVQIDEYGGGSAYRSFAVERIATGRRHFVEEVCRAKNWVAPSGGSYLQDQPHRTLPHRDRSDARQYWQAAQRD